MVLRMKAAPGPLKAIAKDMGMTLSVSPNRPHAATNVPGLTNTVADMLSRRRDPAKQPWSLPEALKGVPRTKLSTRDSKYYLVPYAGRGSLGSE